MLRELRVNNFAIVEDGRLQIGSGMTAFTGETGAGKSLLFDAVTLLLGGKARSHLVRTGSSSAEVEGVFDLSKDAPKRKLASELGFELDEEDGHLLVVRREIAGDESARNRVWIQGKAATRSQLQSLLGDWVEVSGQHEFLRLGREDYVLAIVDQFGGLRHEVESFEEAYLAHRELQLELESSMKAHENKVARLDYLKFQTEELERAGVGPEAAREEQALIALRSRLGNLERVQRGLSAVTSLLEGEEGGEAIGALASVQTSIRELRNLGDYGEEFRAIAQSLEPCEEQLGEIASRVTKLLQSLEADPEELEKAESRLSLMMRAKRKYGMEMDALASLLMEARAELERLENSDERMAALQTRCEQSAQSLRKRATSLHGRRAKAAKALAEAWEKDIRQLGMKQARLDLQVSETDEFRPTGSTRIESMFSANSGESLRPLGKVASGGELSRILLALKHIVAGRSEIGIYLFDEVDSGIGGETANAVAARLRGIAKDNQVIVVTHLAQIAAAAHEQFRIQKQTEKGKTRTVVTKLAKDERPEEIARMLGDTSSKAAKSLAKELIGKAAT